MSPQVEKQEEVIYRADPFTFIFRELDLIHNEIREIKSEIAGIHHRMDLMNDSINKRFEVMSDSINKRFDTMNDSINKRFDTMNDSINKRFDRLYLVVILNLVGMVSFLIKSFFF
ncbi:MAG: hypothetical protein HZA20_01505 [Nitrospirae bacterium]|nr:hypothetical protein [Nitrospirota bacterium]